jgi:hypothetical protein
MKPGTVPHSPIEWLLLKANQIPILLIDTFSAMMNAKAILAANELGLFNALAEGPLGRSLLGLRETAKFTGPEIVRNFEFSAESARLLDIGGGHAGYAIEFCEQNPNLTATVFDLAPTAEIGRDIVERENMSSCASLDNLIAARPGSSIHIKLRL